jgi:hypothetical protein
LELGQNQGANLAGAPMPTGMPGQAVAPSAAVPGPLAALAPPPAKPSIKLKTPTVKPKVKLKAKKKAKPHIKLKASALQGFLDSIGRSP